MMKREERIEGGLWGSLVGDALGVPVEFCHREQLRENPVTDMREHGTHDQLKGTWSDDGALLLCSVESLADRGFDPEDLGRKFLSWYEHGLWAARGEVFDVGLTTAGALKRIAAGTAAELAGSDAWDSNGNGSLMRNLPFGVRFAELPVPRMLDCIYRASGITHGHRRAQMACGLHALLIRELLAGKSPPAAVPDAVALFKEMYSADSGWASELPAFRLLLSGGLAAQPEAFIDSSGYVIHTLTASVWSLLTTDNFEGCALKAVNLGGDTDTTGCVAAGLAGLLYGVKSIPLTWREVLPRQEELTLLFRRFLAVADHI